MRRINQGLLALLFIQLIVTGCARLSEKFEAQMHQPSQYLQTASLHEAERVLVFQEE